MCVLLWGSDLWNVSIFKKCYRCSSHRIAKPFHDSGLSQLSNVLIFLCLRSPVIMLLHHLVNILEMTLAGCGEVSNDPCHPSKIKNLLVQK